ncbi:MAG TPA: FtsQ-type POTRA domain-containing protein [Gemmatimonadales bacterium]|nr:FtsQ-type POTRA domain-containing protein [Gemmatimonadales bacterium]
MTWRTRGLLAALALVSVLGLGVAFPSIIARLAFFRVRAVEVEGIRFLAADEVVRRLDLPADASILVPLAPLRAAAQAIPGVRAAEVRRRWPGTLQVTLLEATPVALHPQDGQMVLLDHHGRVLPFDPARLDTSLPIAPRDSALATLLARLRVADPDGYALVESAERDGADVVLRGRGRELRFRPGAEIADLRDAALVRQYLDANEPGWRAIDARFQKWVFVRRSAS